jgi:hypothetical protein
MLNPAYAPSRWRSVLALGISALLLGGCAEAFTHHQPADAPVWNGTIAGMDKPQCGGFKVVIWRHGDEFRGRAYPTSATGSDLSNNLSAWYVDGMLFENGVVALSLYERTVLPAAQWPSTDWRGVLVGQTVTLAEQPPSCGRSLVVSRTPSAPEKG